MTVRCSHSWAEPAVAETLYARKLAVGPRSQPGVARGVAVFGSPGSTRDASRLDALFERHERLAGWWSEAGHTRRYDPDRLATVEASIDSWHGDSEVAPMLSNEVGTFLGTVLVRVVDRHVGIVVERSRVHRRGQRAGDRRVAA
jgi:hypothetical protein